jgi:hypothetical protein
MTQFDQRCAEQRGPRRWMPAEACSDFGLTYSRRVIPMNWFARSMRSLRRWLSPRHPSPHG